MVEAELASRYLLDLILITNFRAGNIVGKWFGPREFVVGRGRGDNVALSSYLSGKPLNGSGDLFSSHMSILLMKKAMKELDRSVGITDLGRSH